MNSIAPVRPIGSFFESAPELSLGTMSAPPWERRGAVQYVQTGRQALSALAAILEREGRDILLVPAYLCESMIVSFTSERWTLRPYEVAERVEIAADDLARVAEGCDPARTAALTISYFGDEPSAAHVDAVQSLQRRGIRVIEDETHRVLGALPLLGDYGFASLRKVLPVADGAYVRGVKSKILLGDRSHKGWEAMDLKRAGAFTEARSVYATAVDVLEGSHALSPARASERTMQTIQELDYSFMRSQRRANSQTLRSCLSRNKRVRLISTADVPSHVVIQVDDAMHTQAELAKKHVFCPIHWPRPARMDAIAWRAGLLSLPIDHRYGPADMERAGVALEEVLA